MPRTELERVVEQTGAEMERLIAKAQGDALLGLLEDADRDLASRMLMSSRNGLAERYTGVELVATRAQVRAVIANLRKRLGRHLDAESARLSKHGLRSVVATMKAAEKQFTHVSRPLALEQAMRFDNTLHGVRSSLLRQHATSVDRYQHRMLSQIERQLSIGVATNRSQYDMINSIVKLKGPSGPGVSIAAKELSKGQVQRIVTEDIQEGLFVRHRYWAERIVRTELLSSHNTAAQAGIEEEAEQDFPNLQRVLVEVFDNRTGWDSVYAHGQIRGPREYFTDGAGRSYLHPPGRPNDRGHIVPWNASWGPLPKSMAPKPAAEREVAKQKASSDAGRTVAPQM